MENLVFIFTDEQTANTINHPVIETPNLNQLYQESCAFENAYVTQPICTPSRGSIVTGLYPHNHGLTHNNIVMDARVKCLPELLQNPEEYDVVYIGKWHLGNETLAQHGFTRWIGTEDYLYPDYSVETEQPVHQLHSAYAEYLLASGIEPDVVLADGTRHYSMEYCARLPKEFTKAYFVAEQACKVLQEPREKKLILFVNFVEPHPPLAGPYSAYYRSKDISMPFNYAHEIDDSYPMMAHLQKERYRHMETEDKQLWKNDIADYYGLIHLVDEQVGRIKNVLAETCLLDRSLVVFTSDHGDLMASHKMMAKSTMFEEAIKVPMLFRFPHCAYAQAMKTPFTHVDLVPTILEALNEPVPEGLDGESMLSAITGETGLREKDVFVEWNGPWRVYGADVDMDKIRATVWKKFAPQKITDALNGWVRVVITPQGYKYCKCYDDNNALFNLNTDPGEMKNLIAEPEYHEIVKQLDEKIACWQKNVNDNICFKKNAEKKS